jgi:hypothetical protein
MVQLWAVSTGDEIHEPLLAFLAVPLYNWEDYAIHIFER